MGSQVSHQWGSPRGAVEEGAIAVGFCPMESQPSRAGKGASEVRRSEEVLEGRGSRGGEGLIHFTENLVWPQETGSGLRLEGPNPRSEGWRKQVLVARGTEEVGGGV